MIEEHSYWNDKDIVADRNKFLRRKSGFCSWKNCVEHAEKLQREDFGRKWLKSTPSNPPSLALMKTQAPLKKKMRMIGQNKKDPVMMITTL